jgi:hypothetical protein
MSGFFFKKKLFCVVLLAVFCYQSDYLEKNCDQVNCWTEFG